MTSLTPDNLRRRIKEGSIVLWLYRGGVEEGTVLFVNGDTVDLVWLEGYKSRNDSVAFDDILSLHDKRGPEHTLDVFTGHGFLTEAGVRWQQSHPS